MTAGISVNLRSATPPYEQIRSQISSLIAVGTLAGGSRLPTVRSLAADLGIAAGTVARAYKELESAGLIETRRRNGTVVIGRPADGIDGGGSPAVAAVTGEVITAVDHLIGTGRRAGLDDGTLLELLGGRLREIRERRLDG